jgi:hypothetical protein
MYNKISPVNHQHYRQLLMSLLLGHRPSLWFTHMENGHKSRGTIADWWVLTTVNAAGTNSLTLIFITALCKAKHKFVIIIGVIRCA